MKSSLRRLCWATSVLGIALLGIVILFLKDPNMRSPSGQFQFIPQGHLERQFPNASEEDILFHEELLGYRFPDDYRAFLQQINGAFIPGGAEFVYGKDIDPVSRQPIELRGCVVHFLNVGKYDSHNEPVWKLTAYDFEERVPKGYIPIGHGNDFRFTVLCLDGAERGAVFYWHPSMDWEEGGNVQTTEYLTKVADSFQEFWRKLEWPTE